MIVLLAHILKQILMAVATIAIILKLDFSLAENVRCMEKAFRVRVVMSVQILATKNIVTS